MYLTVSPWVFIELKSALTATAWLWAELRGVLASAHNSSLSRCQTDNRHVRGAIWGWQRKNGAGISQEPVKRDKDEKKTEKKKREHTVCYVEELMVPWGKDAPGWIVLKCFKPRCGAGREVLLLQNSQHGSMKAETGVWKAILSVCLSPFGSEHHLIPSVCVCLSE